MVRFGLDMGGCWMNSVLTVWVLGVGGGVGIRDICRGTSLCVKGNDAGMLLCGLGTAVLE
jgi:hypothetical protein